MANTFYNVTYSFSEKTLARGTEVRQELNSIASAFNSVESFYNNKFTPLTLFNQLHLGYKTTAPNLDNDGQPLQVGASYFDSVYQCDGVWNGLTFIYSAKNSKDSATSAATSASQAAASASLAGSYVATVQQSADDAAASAADAAVSAYNSANSAAQNTAGLSTALNNHTGDYTLHLTSDQNTFLDGISVTFSQVNNTVNNFTTHSADTALHLTPLQNVFLDGLSVSYSQVNYAASNFANHEVNTGLHLTVSDSTFLRGLTVSYSQVNNAAANYSTHVTDTSLHLTSSQNTLLDSLTSTAYELNLLSGSNKGSNFNTENQRAAVRTLTNGATLIAGSTYCVNTITSALSAVLPTIANTVKGDEIVILNSRRSWGTNSFTISSAPGIYIMAGTNLSASGESLICDTNNFPGFTLKCNDTDSTTYAYWSVL
jgi:hypothetical protein